MTQHKRVVRRFTHVATISDKTKHGFRNESCAMSFRLNKWFSYKNEAFSPDDGTSLDEKNTAKLDLNSIRELARPLVL